VRPDCGQKQRRACGYETEEEDDNKRVFVMHKVVAQPGATIGDAAIGEFQIELAQYGGGVDDEETVEEAYRGVSADFRAMYMNKRPCSHLKAGSRPKNATNVTKDTVTVKRMMVRATVMVKEGPIGGHVAWRTKGGGRQLWLLFTHTSEI
jgi:hypothetical protein